MRRGLPEFVACALSLAYVGHAPQVDVVGRVPFPHCFVLFTQFWISLPSQLKFINLWPREQMAPGLISPPFRHLVSDSPRSNTHSSGYQSESFPLCQTPYESPSPVFSCSKVTDQNDRLSLFCSINRPPFTEFYLWTCGSVIWEAILGLDSSLYYIPSQGSSWQFIY